MGKKIKIKWQGGNFKAKYSVDTVTGEVKDLNHQPLTLDDVKIVIANLANKNRKDIGAIVRKRYFGNQ